MSDITQYRTKRSSPSVTRRAKSNPTLSPSSSIFSKQKPNTTLPPVITYGEHNGVPIIVFGEVHNMIDNKFYENLDMRGNTIFVEHASALCKISKEDKPRLFNILRGSDWVWYKYASRNQSVVCVDNRIELGLPTAIEEKFALKTEDTNDLPIVMDCVMRSLRVFTSPEVKQSFIKAKLAAIYNKSMEAMKKQMTVLLKAGSLNTQALLDTKYNLIQNTMKLSGMMVDLNTMKKIEEHTGYRDTKPIMIFMGAAHAYRLKMFFPEVFTAFDLNDVSPELMEALETMVYE